MSVVVCDIEDREDRPEVWNILLEWYLTLPASGGGEKRREFKVKAMTVLRSSMFSYDPTCALILCSTKFTVRLGQYCYRRGG